MSRRPGFNPGSYQRLKKWYLMLHCKVRIKGKRVQCREWSSALPSTSVLYLLKREPLGQPRLKSTKGCMYICIEGVRRVIVTGEMDMTTRVQILDVTVSFPQCANTLGRVMNPIILPPAVESATYIIFRTVVLHVSMRCRSAIKICWEQW